MFKKVGLLLVVLALLVSIAAGCSSKSASNPIELVPEGATMLAQIDFNKIITDEEITELYDKAPKDWYHPRTVEELRASIQDELDIDLTELNTITFFGDTSVFDEEDSPTNFAIIVEGTFNKNDLLAAIDDKVVEAHAYMEVSEYKGYDVYIIEGAEVVYVFLSDKMLAIGPQLSIEDVIDVAKGDKKALSGVVLDTYNDLDEALLKVAVETVSPGQVDEELPDEMGEFLGDLSAFEDIKTVGITLGRENNFLAFDTKLCAADSDSAEAIEQAIEGMIAFIGLLASFSDDPEAAESLLAALEDLDISTSGSCVTINLDVTFSEIEDLIAEGLGQLE